MNSSALTNSSKEDQNNDKFSGHHFNSASVVDLNECDFLCTTLRFQQKSFV